MLFFKSSRPNPFSDGSLFFMRSAEVIWNIKWLLCWLIFGVLHEWQSIQSNSRYSRFEFHYLGLHGKKWLVIPRIYIHPFIVSAMPGWQLPRQEQCLQAPSLSLHLGGHLTSSCQWNVRASLLKGIWGHLYCLFPFSSKVLEDDGATLWKEYGSLNYHVEACCLPTRNTHNGLLYEKRNRILLYFGAVCYSSQCYANQYILKYIICVAWFMLRLREYV